MYVADNLACIAPCCEMVSMKSQKSQFNLFNICTNLLNRDGHNVQNVHNEHNVHNDKAYVYKVSNLTTHTQIQALGKMCTFKFDY